MKAFRKLDQDGSGSLSVSDLTANLKSEKKKKKAAEKSCDDIDSKEQESPEVDVSNWGAPTSSDGSASEAPASEAPASETPASEAPAEDVIRDAEKALEE